MDGPAEEREGRVWVLLPPFAIGARRFVDRFRISFPFTTRLSLDFRRSLVSISVLVSIYRFASCGVQLPTVSASIQVDDAAYADVDHAQKALVLLLELLLVEYLHGKDAFLCHTPVR